MKGQPTSDEAWFNFYEIFPKTFLFRVKMLTRYRKYADIRENYDVTPTFLVESLSLRVVLHNDQIGGSMDHFCDF